MDTEIPSKATTRANQSKKNQKLARDVSQRLTDMKSNRQRIGDGKWDKWDRMYQSIPNGEPEEDWMANVFVPFVMSTVLAIIAELADQNNGWVVQPQAPDDEECATTLNSITDYTKWKGQWHDEQFGCYMDKLIYGTSVWKEFYREDRRTIKKPQYDKEGNLTSIENEDIREFNDVYGKQIPIRAFYLDDKATSLRTARDCIERNVMDIRDFKIRYAKYELSKKVKEWGFIKPTISESQIQNIPAGGDVSTLGAFIPISPIKDNDIEVLEYWNKPDDQHVISANGIIVVDEPIPYWHKQLPYAMDVCIPVPNSAYGMGVPQLLESTNEEMNTYHNMMLDEGKISIHRPILVGGMTVLDEDEYQLKPGGLIPVDDVSQALPMPIQGLMATHFQMYEEIKQTGRVASGLDVRFAESNSPQGGTDSATEVMRLQASSIRRIGLLSKMMKIRFLPRIGMLRTANIQQFYQDPLRVDLITSDGESLEMNEQTGKVEHKKVFRNIRSQDPQTGTYSFQEITPERIRGNVDVYVVPQAQEDPTADVLAKRINTILQTVVAFPPMLQVIDLTQLLRHYFQQISLPTNIVRDTLIQPEADYLLAQQENDDMSKGQDVPPTPNPTTKHTAVHAAYIYQLDQEMQPTGELNPHFQQLPPKTQAIFMKHYEGELKTQALKGNVPTDKGRTQPIGGTGTQAVAGGQEMNTQAS